MRSTFFLRKTICLAFFSLGNLIAWGQIEKDTLVITIPECKIVDPILISMTADFISLSDSCSENNHVFIQVLASDNVPISIKSSLCDSIYYLNQFPGEKSGNSYKFALSFATDSSLFLYRTWKSLFVGFINDRRVFIGSNDFKVVLPSTNDSLVLRRYYNPLIVPYYKFESCEYKTATYLYVPSFVEELKRVDYITVPLMSN